MEICDNCSEEVRDVWKHRSYDETMTHREISWLCAECHPSMNAELRNA